MDTLSGSLTNTERSKMEVKPMMFTSRVNRNPIERASVIMGLLLASCTMHQPGLPPMTIRSPAAPPPSSALSSQPVTPGSLNGVYSGIARPLAGNCLTAQKVTNFRVLGNSVRWGVFRGTIDRNRGVQMAYRGNRLFGKFIGTQFSGVLQRAGNPWIRGPACSYRLLLQRG
jgi:hypothetical protein